MNLTNYTLFKVQILPDFFLNKKWYEIANAAFDIENRLTNIMNGYWTDEEASKLCLKVRADRPYLHAVPEKDLDNIKGKLYTCIVFTFIDFRKSVG